MNYILIDNNKEQTLYKNIDKQQYNNIVANLKPTQKLIETTKQSLEVSINYNYNEYNNLINWFNNEYSKLEQKYRRLYTLKLYCDNGEHPYDKLLALYEEAEAKRRRIQELEVLINE